MKKPPPLAPCDWCGTLARVLTKVPIYPPDRNGNARAHALLCDNCFARHYHPEAALPPRKKREP